jgi:uncharacterized membrane protein
MRTGSMTLSPAVPSRTLHVALWVVQLLLAAVFVLVGWTHALAPIEVAIARAPWVADLPAALVRFIGIAELAGAAGLVLPAATRIRPRLTALAAAGLATMMVLAIPFHLVRGEAKEVTINVVLGSLAAVVAWGRARQRALAAAD